MSHRSTTSAALATVIGWIATLASPAAWPAETAKFDVELPYQAARRDAVTHQVDFTVVVTPPYQCRQLRVWLPLPQSDAAQQISGSQLTTFPMEVEPQVATETVYGNKFACFEFRDPQGAQIIRHRFTAKVWELRWGLEPSKVLDVPSWPAAFDPYLQSQPLAHEAQLNQVLGELAPSRSGAAHDLLKVMNWIDENLTYDHVNASLQADADHALTQRRGHCSDYHGLCATMGRRLGYPTRVTYGLSLYPKSSPSHCKLESFLPPYGWVTFDLSETQKLVRRIQQSEDLDAGRAKSLAAAARARLHGGFRENSWLLLTKGTNYELPPPASGPVHLVRTIYAEADGEPLPEPDPSNPQQRKFAWMTVHKYTADRPFRLPSDLATLDEE